MQIAPISLCPTNILLTEREKLSWNEVVGSQAPQEQTGRILFFYLMTKRVDIYKLRKMLFWVFYRENGENKV